MKHFVYGMKAINGLSLFHSGKVRDTYSIYEHPEYLCMIASDRISTHNVVHTSTVPQKGHILTAMTVFWMTQKLSNFNTHLIAYGNDIYKYLPQDVVYPKDLHLRAVVVLKLTVIPIEFVFRIRLAGSLWKDYYSKGIRNPYGLDLPDGMQIMSSFDSMVFTPTRKSENDEPRNAAYVKARYPRAYRLAREVTEIGMLHAERCGIEIIDTKLEIGRDMHGDLYLADECLTPDSSRFVDASGIVVGQEPSFLDKEFLRAYAEKTWQGGHKMPLVFPQEIIEETTRRYLEIFETLVGTSLGVFQAWNFEMVR